MTTVKCERCGKDIASNLKVCPFCGVKRKPRRTFMGCLGRGTLVVVGLLVGLVVIAAIFAPKMPPGSTPSQSASTDTAGASNPLPALDRPEDQQASGESPVQVESFRESGVLGIRLTDTSDSPVRIISITANGRPSCSAHIGKIMRTGDVIAVTDVHSPVTAFFGPLYILGADCGQSIVKAKVVTDRGWYEFGFQ